MKKLINQYRRWNPSIYAIVLLMITPFLVYVIINFKIDNDFWFLINTGKTILTEGFIRIEPFTIHSGLAFIPQQWLTDVIFDIIYSKFDIRGMYYLFIICNSIIIFISYKLCYLVSNSRKKAAFLTIFMDLFLIITNSISTRPQMFDIIVFLLELYLLELYCYKNNKKYLYMIPVISILFINLHASMWFMIFVFTLPYIVEYFVKRKLKQNTFNIMPLLIIIIISFLAGFINPYGIDAIKYLINSYGIKEINSFVNEMEPVTIVSPFGIIIYTIIFFMLASFYKNKGNNKLRYFLLCMGIVFLSLLHIKARIQLVVIFPLIIGYNFKSKYNSNKVRVLPYEKVIYCIMIIVSMFLIISNTKLTDDVWIKEFGDYLDDNASFDIKLFADYNNGGYMEYRGYKCYIDPRAEVFLKGNNHKEDIFVEYFNLENYKIEAIDFLNKYDFDYLLVDERSKNLMKELNNNSDYKEVYSKVTEPDTKEKTYLFEHIRNNKNT